METARPRQGAALSGQEFNQRGRATAGAEIFGIGKQDILRICQLDDRTKVVRR